MVCSLCCPLGLAMLLLDAWLVYPSYSRTQANEQKPFCKRDLIYKTCGGV